MGSCVGTLRRIQRDMGFTDKDLKQAVHNIATPRKVKLEEIVIHPSKAEKKEEKRQKKLMKKAKKKKKIKWAYWYLEKYLKKEFAYELFYSKYDKFKDLINAAYEAFLGLVQFLTFRIRPISEAEMLDILRENEPEVHDPDAIPDSQWEAYGEYLKKHPLKKNESIFDKRHNFLKSLRKTKRKYYSKKRLAMYDPIYEMSHVEEKEMLKNLERISYQNELRIQEFHAFLDSLFKNNDVSKDIMRKFNQQTNQMIAHHKKRIKEFRKRTTKVRPTPIIMDIDDGPSIKYDDWDDPDSIDSVLQIPIKEIM